MAAGSRWMLASMAAEGGGAVTPLLESAHRLYPSAWSGDGRVLFYQELRPESGWDLWSVAWDASGRRSEQAQPLVRTPRNEENAVPSPDGTWFAYESEDVDGVVQLFVAPLARPAQKVQVTRTGARCPRWTRAGGLVYLNTVDRRLYQVAGHDEAGRWRAGEHHRFTPPAQRAAGSLLDALQHPAGTQEYDLAPLTDQLIVFERVEPGRGPDPPQMSVALDFFAQVRARLSTGR
jgi:hypothetical protein